MLRGLGIAACRVAQVSVVSRTASRSLKESTISSGFCLNCLVTDASEEPAGDVHPDWLQKTIVAI